VEATVLCWPYIRYLRTQAKGLHFLKSIALDGSFWYETVEYFSHIPPREMNFRRDAPYYRAASLRGQMLKIDDTTDTDCDERIDWYSNMYLTRKPISHHVWVWYDEKPKLEQDVFRLKHERKHGEKHVHISARNTLIPFIQMRT
jgi:hypothetical protein